jgi:hypothetical protein
MRALWISTPILLASFAVLVSYSTMPKFERIAIIAFCLLLAAIVYILRFG